MVSWIWICNEDSGDVTAVCGGAYGHAGQFLGGHRPCRDPQHRHSCAHRISNLGSLAVDDGDGDDQPSAW